jgi:organic radical activating enzyme
MCLAKWYNATIWLGSGQTTSCHHPLPHQADEQEIRFNPKAIHNTAHKKNERRQMQDGERPPGCEYCWKVEDIGRDNISDRVYKSVIYTDDLLKEAWESDYTADVDLRTLEIAFDRTCQFACSYCNPAFSTTWVNDLKKNGNYINLHTDGRGHYDHLHDAAGKYDHDPENPYIEAFFKWWESDLHRTLSELRVTGGEPLMSPHTWRLLDWFATNEKRNKSMRLAINSNLGGKDELIDRLVDKAQYVDDLQVYTSNEAVGIQAEYIRDGLDWEQWVGNMHKLARSGNFKALHVMCTINLLCLESLTEFLDWMLDFKKQYGSHFPVYSLNILRFPSFQSPTVMPDALRQERKEKLQAWFDKNKHNPLLHQMELNQTQRLIDYLDVVKTPHKDAFEREKLEKDFKSFYAQYDQRRGKDFAAAFPNLMPWINSIE